MRQKSAVFLILLGLGSPPLAGATVPDFTPRAGVTQIARLKALDRARAFHGFALGAPATALAELSRVCHELNPSSDARDCGLSQESQAAIKSEMKNVAHSGEAMAFLAAAEEVRETQSDVLAGWLELRAEIYGAPSQVSRPSTRIPPFAAKGIRPDDYRFVVGLANIVTIGRLFSEAARRARASVLIERLIDADNIEIAARARSAKKHLALLPDPASQKSVAVAALSSSARESLRQTRCYLQWVANRGPGKLSCR